MYTEEFLITQIENAHKAGQFNAGCMEPSESEVLAFRTRLINDLHEYHKEFGTPPDKTRSLLTAIEYAYENMLLGNHVAAGAALQSAIKNFNESKSITDKK